MKKIKTPLFTFDLGICWKWETYFFDIFYGEGCFLPVVNI